MVGAAAIAVGLIAACPYEMRQRYVLQILTDQACVLRDHNVYKDFCLHPIRCHNADIS